MRIDKKPRLSTLQKIMDKNQGSLDLRGTQITSLPDNLTVGGWLDLRGTQITGNRKYNRLNDGDYVQDRYLYADGILTHVKRKKTIGDYTYYVGKIHGQDVIQRGNVYAHCRSFKEGVRDIEFKLANERGADQYKSLTAESVLTVDEAVVAYRIITGACQAGTQRFLDSLGEIKNAYTVQEIMDMTKDQYGGRTFAEFITGR